MFGNVELSSPVCGYLLTFGKRHFLREFG